MSKKKRPKLLKRELTCPNCKTNLTGELGKRYVLFFRKCIFCGAEVENGVKE